MPLSMVGVYIIASLISGVSAALILANGSGYTEARSLGAPAYNAKRGPSTYEECRAGSCVYLNSLEDFCLWVPSLPVLSVENMEHTERTLAAWCVKGDHGANLIPDGTISGARFVRTSTYVQITGVGNLTKMNIPAEGVASASGEGGRAHSLVFTSVYGQLERIYQWTSFMSQGQFCFRACKSSAAAPTCLPIFDISDCLNDIPGNYDGTVLEDCVEGATEASFVVHQEALGSPSHHYRHPSFSCMPLNTVGNARITHARRVIPSTSGSTSSAPVTSFSPSPEQITSLTSSATAVSTNTATMITFPSFPTSTSNATASANSTTQASTTLSTSSTSSPSFHNLTYTHSHWHAHTHTHSHNHTSSTSIFMSSSSSTAYSFTYPSPMASSSLAFPTNSSSILAWGTPAPSVTSTSSLITILAPTPKFTSTSTAAPSHSSTPPSSYSQPFSSQPFSSYDSSASSTVPTPSSSSLSEPLSSQSFTSYDSSSSSTETPTSSPAAPPTSSATSSQNPTSHHSPSSAPASSSPTSTPLAASSPTSPNSQTQVGSQCPPPSRRVINAAVPLAPLIYAVLMVVISSFASMLII